MEKQKHYADCKRKNIGGGGAKYFIKQQKALGKCEGYVEEMINGQKVVKVFNHEPKSKEKFRKSILGGLYESFWISITFLWCFHNKAKKIIDAAKQIPTIGIIETITCAAGETIWFI